MLHTHVQHRVLKNISAKRTIQSLKPFFFFLIYNVIQLSRSQLIIVTLNVIVLVLNPNDHRNEGQVKTKERSFLLKIEEKSRHICIFKLK